MAKKKVQKNSISPLANLAVGILLLVACYGLASWAIDSGSMWAYLATFMTLYFGIRSLGIFAKEQYFNNDKTRKISKS